MDTHTINEYGEIVNTTKDVIEALYVNPTLDLTLVNIKDVDEIGKYNRAASSLHDNVSPLVRATETYISLSTFDIHNQNQWFIPPHYMDIDIMDRLHQRCNDTHEHVRVTEEIKLFEERGMLPVLHYMIYLVDVMRKNNIVWGIGRGSSVASFCLYLIGINKINPIKYNLSIEEFLR